MSLAFNYIALCGAEPIHSSVPGSSRGARFCSRLASELTLAGLMLNAGLRFPRLRRIDMWLVEDGAVKRLEYVGIVKFLSSHKSWFSGTWFSCQGNNRFGNPLGHFHAYRLFMFPVTCVLYDLCCDEQSVQEESETSHWDDYALVN